MRFQICAFLRAEGGSAPVSRVGSTFQVNRAQLQALGFTLTAPDSSGQSIVGLPSARPPPAGSANARALNMGVMQATGVKRFAPPAPALDAKRFALGRPAQMATSLRTGPKANPPASAGGNALLQTLQAAGFGNDVLTQLAGAIQSSIGQGNAGKSNGMMLPRPQVPAKPQASSPAKLQGSTPALVSYKVRGEIASYINEQGGSAQLAVIGSKFMVNKAQLEGAGFAISPPDHNGQRQVSLH